MRIAFYAPMKPPDHDTPSGDRQIARLLIAALEGLGHTVALASRLRTWQRDPDDETVRRNAADSEREAARILAAGTRPDLFLTYHVYHKAPDWIGPAVSAALDIPYVIVEASHAEHRRAGPWRTGLEAAERAIRAADAVAVMSARDRRGLAGVVAPEALYDLAPFIDAAPFRGSARVPHDGPVRLLTVAMMRHGDKEASYRVLADALSRLGDLDWTLTVAGDGPARDEIAAMFPPDRTRFAGMVERDALPALYADADLFVWPGVKEAYGMVYLEAMAAGLPVVGGLDGGVPDVVRDGETGLLRPATDAAAMAEAIRALIGDSALRRRMGDAAAAHVTERHDIGAASATLEAILAAAVARNGARP
ncbi:MAG: glycosyltransferase family 4 protein [Rhodobiaceae bacterium]|nr:glycosyltransferase family 4 protein [Rhodobiaceae bacterium]